MSGLLILGGGGHGKAVADVAAAAGAWRRIAFLDDAEELREVLGYPVVGPLHRYADLLQEYRHAFVAMGNNRRRLEWMDRLLQAGYRIPTLIHPFTAVSPRARIGAGTVVMGGVVVNADAVIGQGCILNTGCSVDHDCVVADGAHLSPGVRLAGAVHVGKRAWLCTGAVVGNNIRIGEDAVVAAGAAVVRDVPDRTLVAGVPAMVKKRLETT